MNERSVQGVVGVAAHQVDAGFQFGVYDPGRLVAALCSGQVADRAGNDGHFVSATDQTARQFVVARAAGFVQCCECLVNEQDMHGSAVREDEMTAEFYIILAFDLQGTGKGGFFLPVGGCIPSRDPGDS